MRAFLIILSFFAASSSFARGLDKAELLKAMEIERGRCAMENVPDGGKYNFYFNCTGRTTNSFFELWLEGTDEDQIAGYGESETFDGKVQKSCGVSGQVEKSGKVTLLINCVQQ